MTELSVTEAAERLGVHPTRVRSLLTSGELEGRRVGSIWLVDADAVARRVETAGATGGRPFSARIAWSAAALLDGQATPWLTTSERSRLRTRIRAKADAGTYRWWLRSRATATRYRIPDGDIGEFLADEHVVAGGISAASRYGLGLGHGNEAEAYTDRSSALQLVDAFFLVESTKGNLVLHVADDAWSHRTAHAADGLLVAPRLVVAADLMDSDDTRSRSAGSRLLHQALESLGTDRAS